MAIHLFSTLLDSSNADAYILKCRASAYALTGQNELATRDQVDLLQFQLESIPELETINAIDSTLPISIEAGAFWGCFTELGFLCQPERVLSGIYILRITK